MSGITEASTQWFVGNYLHLKKRMIYVFFVVLAYLPTNNDPFAEDPHTIYPEGMETVPPRFAVGKRNLWMLDRSGFVVTYVRRDTGGAARFRHIAEKKGKTIITL